VSRPLAHAVLTAYEHLLEHGQHPVFVLHLTIDPHRVDVNVHPQKHEVKFDDERSAYLLAQSAVTTALRTAEVVPAFLGDVPLAASPLQSLPIQPGGTPTYVNRLTGEITSTDQRSWLSRSRSPQGAQRSSIFDVRSPQDAQRSSIFDMRSPQDALRSSIFDIRSPQEAQQGALPALQAGQQYVVTYTADGLVVIDQAPAHERILFERVMARGSGLQRSEQALLFSVRIALAPSDVAVLREYAEQFTALGFRLDIHDATNVEVHAVPSDVQPGSEEDVLMAMLDGLRLMGVVPRERRHEGVAAVYASKQAMRRGERLTPDEMRTLVQDLFACQQPHLSPSGAPTFIIIPYEELASRLR
jgi:DNA mismatch repair protein MutL